MTLVVENGTGIAGAESYLSVADLRAYAAGRGKDISTATDLQCEIGLRLGAEWIDTWRRYKGTRIADREFPRDGLTDWSGDVVGLPKRVRDANAELAIRQIGGVSLAPDADREAYVKSASVGPISTTYRDDAPVVTTFTVVERLLEPYIREEIGLNVPYSGGDNTALFDRNMMSFEGAPSSASLLGED